MDAAGDNVMKVYLINRADVQVFGREGLMKVFRDKNGEYIETGHTAGEQAELRMVRTAELSRRHWILYVLFFWIIGFFGFLTPRYSKFAGNLDGTVRFTERPGNILKIRFTHFAGRKESGEIAAMTVFGDEGAVIENGNYIPDRAAGRRYKLYKLCSWAARLVIVVLLIVFLINL